MDFIERWLGVSPDGGNGRLEITLILVALVVVAAPLLVSRFRFGARRARKTDER
ncbi:MAG TPA: hypothetical protein VH640_22005 [Bryobacteraceae bacterium]|jgi:hypothetical protein